MPYSVLGENSCKDSLAVFVFIQQGIMAEDIGVKVIKIEDATPEQLARMKQSYIKGRVVSEYYNDRFKEKVKQLGITQEQLWAKKFDKKMKRPNLYCIVAYPLADPDVVAGLAVIARASESSVFVFHGGIDPDYQNRGIGRRMGVKMVEYFPRDTIWGMVHNTNSISRDRSLNYGEVVPPDTVLGNMRLKPNYHYFIVSKAKL